MATYVENPRGSLKIVFQFLGIYLPNASLILLIFIFPPKTFAQVETDFSSGGAVRVGDSSTACDGTIEGAIRFDADGANTIDYCNGVSWLSFVTGSVTSVVNNGNSFAAPMIIGTNDNNTLAFETNGIDRMIIDTSGNVGIGTATPTTLLHIHDASGMGNWGSHNLGGADFRLGSFYAEGDTWLLNSGANSLKLGTFSNGNLEFGTNDTQRMTIDASGNVGIATTTPSYPLEVDGHVHFMDNVYLGNGNAYINNPANAINFATNGSARMYLSSAGNLHIGTNTQAANKLDVSGAVVIGSNYATSETAPAEGLLVEGSVGIGTNSPAAMLDVEGDVQFGSNGVDGFDFDVSEGRIMAGNDGLNYLDLYDAVADVTLRANVDLNFIASDTPGAGSFKFSSAPIEVGPNNTTPGSGGSIRFDELTANTGAGNIEYVGFRAPDSIADGDEVIWQLPSADGSAGQVLQTDGSGVLAWVANGSGAGDFLADGSVPMTNQFRAHVGSEAAPSISFNGDLDTGLYHPAADQVAVTVGGHESMVFREGRFQMFSEDDTSDDPQFFGYGNNGANRGVDLTVYRSNGGSAGSEVLVPNGYKVAGFRGEAFDGSTYRTAAEMLIETDGVTGGGDMPGRFIFNITADGDSNTTQRVIFDNSGRVGIGVNNPNDILDISESVNGGAVVDLDNPDSGAAAFTVFRARNDLNDEMDIGIRSSTNNDNVFESGAAFLYTDSPTGLSLGADNATGEIRFATGGDLEQMRIDSAGRLGIGITTPQFETHIHDSATGSGTESALLITTGDTGSASNDGLQLGLHNDGSSTYALVLNHEASDLRLGTGGSVDMTISSSGAVGIGTQSPGAELDVTGTGAIIVPNGLDGERPGSPQNGMIRYNTTGNKMEAYENGGWTDMIGGGGGGGDFLADGSVPMTGTFKAADGTVALPGITFNSDLNTGFYRIGTDDIGLATDGEIALSVNGAKEFAYYNNSGVMTLDLDAGSGEFRILDNSAVERVRLNSGGELRLKDSSDNVRATLNTSGLEIKDSSGANRSIIDGSGNVSLRDSSGINVFDFNTSSNEFIIEDDSGQDRMTLDGDDGFISLENSSNVETVRIETESGASFFNSGNVGIGTISPSGKLDIVGGDLRIEHTTSQLVHKETDAAADEKVWIWGAVGGSYTFSLWHDAELVAGDQAMAFNRTGDTLDSVIFPNGNVGIGTSSPGAELDVTGTGAIIVPNGTDAQQPGSPQNGMIRYNTDNDKMEAYENGGWTDMIGGGGGGSIDALSDASTDYANDNIFLGSGSGANITSSTASTALGEGALATLSSGIHTTAVGFEALNAQTTQQDSTAVGYRALGRSIGANNTALGSDAGYGLTGIEWNNTTIGAGTMSNGSGGQNTAVGSGAMWNIGSNSDENTAIGVDTLTAINGGDQNVAVGKGAGQATGSSANRNVFLGFESGKNITAADNNIMLGYRAGDLTTTGDSNILIGYDIDATSATASNELNIGDAIYGDLSAGNIGIGTPTPGSKLHIYHASGDREMIQLRGNAHSTNLLLGTVNGDTAVVGGGSGDSLVLYSNDDVDSGMIIDSSGDVGIGTTTPGAELDVTGTGAIIVPNGLDGERPASPQNGMIRYNTTGNKMEAYENGGWADLVSTGGSGDFLADGSVAMTGVLDLTAGTAAAPAIAFTPGFSGFFDVGAGVWGYAYATTEKFRFTTNGIQLFQANTYLSTFTAGSFHLVNNDGSSAGTPTYTFRSDTDMGLFRPAADTLGFSTAGSERMRIDASGNVGIGTSSPTAELTVWGDIEFEGVITDISDRRLKDEIKPLRGALDKVSELEGVSFVMKHDENREKEFGVIAQDVEKVIPELVKTADDERKTKSVNYQGFIGWMIEAIKELASESFDWNQRQDDAIEGLQKGERTLASENSSLRKRLDEKDQEIKELKSRLEKIEKALQFQ